MKGEEEIERESETERHKKYKYNCVLSPKPRDREGSEIDRVTEKVRERRMARGEGGRERKIKMSKQQLTFPSCRKLIIF